MKNKIENYGVFAPDPEDLEESLNEISTNKNEE
jgi:hypothetical protein